MEAGAGLRAVLVDGLPTCTRGRSATDSRGSEPLLALDVTDLCELELESTDDDACDKADCGCVRVLHTHTHTHVHTREKQKQSECERDHGRN